MGRAVVVAVAVSERTGGLVGAPAEAAQRSGCRTCSDLSDRGRVLPSVLSLHEPELTPRLVLPPLR